MTNVYPLKCRIQAAADVTRVDVYDDIGPGGWFSDGLTAKDFTAQLAGVKGPLQVHINSGGGDVFDGIAIGNALQAHKAPVTVVVDGLAASIASVIAQAGAERIMQPGSMMMIHDAFGACVGDAAEMAKMAETLDQVSENLAHIYAERSGRPDAYWRDQMKAETWYTAEEAVAAGLADRVGDGKAELPPGLDVAAFTAPGRIAAALRSLPRSAAAGSCCERCGPGCACMEPQGRAGRPRAAAMHGDHERYDPDGDGDCDACPEGDTDHDYWAPDGTQKKPVPGKPMSGLTEDRIRAIVREELGLRNADKYKQEDRDRMAKSGQAMPDGSYPIADEEDLDNAIRAVGRGGADHDAIRRHIIKRAAALGLSSKIPDNWNSDGSLKDASNHAGGLPAWIAAMP